MNKTTNDINHKGAKMTKKHLIFLTKQTNKKHCSHKYGQYKPNTSEGKELICSQCGIELDVITRKLVKSN